MFILYWKWRVYCCHYSQCKTI